MTVKRMDGTLTLAIAEQVPGHFDINSSPAGWNNPKIYWQKLDDEECL